MKVPDKITHDFTMNTIQRYTEDVGRVLRAISFGDGTNNCEGQNIEGHFISGTLNVKDTEQSFDHSLGRKPVGFHVVSRNKGAIIYDGATANTDKKIYLRASLDAMNFKIFIF